MIQNDKVSCWKLFWVFSKIGAFTIGGGYAMLPLVEKEITSRKWMSEEDMADMIVLAQSAPGLIAVNLAIYTGHKLAGLKGSIISTLGAILPSFLIILLIAMLFTNFSDNPIVNKMFQAMRPVAIAMIVVPAVKMAKKGCINWWTGLIAVVTACLVAFLKVSPVWIIVSILTIGIGTGLLKERKK